MAYVANVAGTSDLKCKCGTWYDHWKKFSGQTVTFCSEASCTEKVLVGAHVQKSGVLDTSWYIIPLCHKHNMKTTSLRIVDSVKLVPANKKLTCEK